MVPFAKLRDFSQTIFDSAREVVPVGLGRAQFIFVSLSDLGGSLRQFGFEARPTLLVVVIVLLLKQPESFFSGELRDASEVFDPEAIQNLGALQFPCAATQRAFDGVISDSRRSLPSCLGIRALRKIRLVLGRNLR